MSSKYLLRLLLDIYRKSDVVAGYNSSTEKTHVIASTFAICSSAEQITYVFDFLMFLLTTTPIIAIL